VLTIFGRSREACFEKGKALKDISRIACTGGGFLRPCLAIDDDMQAAQFVRVHDGELGSLAGRDRLDPPQLGWSSASHLRAPHFKMRLMEANLSCF
jgi:hypothetical protein